MKFKKGKIQPIHDCRGDVIGFDIKAPKLRTTFWDRLRVVWPSNWMVTHVNFWF